MPGHTVGHDFFKVLDQTEILVSTIYICKKSPPPTRRDGSVTKFSEVKWDANIDLEELPLLNSSRSTHLRRLDYRVEMKRKGGSSAEFSIFHEGKRQATKDVSVEFHDRADV